LKPIKAVDVTIDGTGGQKELAGMLDRTQEPDLKTPEDRMAMAREVLEMIGRNIKIEDGGREAAGVSPVIFNEIQALTRNPDQSLKVWNLPIIKTQGMPPGSAFLLRGRSIVRILTFGRD
jgi:hypothetical protein